MLEKPNIQDETIVACLRDKYRLQVVDIAFLPLGAGRHTAVYRANTSDATVYFVKLRSGDFNGISIIVPKYLHDRDIQQIIAPLSTQSQDLWADVGDFKLTISPFVEGHNGYEVDLTDTHWVDFGRTLKRIHTTEIPSAIADRVQRETFSSHWREAVRGFQQQAENTTFHDHVAAKLATWLNHKHDEISKLIGRAEYLAAILLSQPLKFVLCHADIHAGNILIDTNSHLYVVDWDTLIMAPKERDLMYIGGGQFVYKRSPDEEERLFYQGYGQIQADPVGLAYYRYERIVQDIADYCEQILFTGEGGEDREKGLRQLMTQFQPGNVVEVAYLAEDILPQEHRAE